MIILVLAQSFNLRMAAISAKTARNRLILIYCWYFRKVQTQVTF